MVKLTSIIVSMAMLSSVSMTVLASSYTDARYAGAYEAITGILLNTCSETYIIDNMTLRLFL